MDIKFKLYPHPVLWDKVDDYKTSKFDCEINMKREIKRFSFEINFKLDNKELENMIEQNLAEFVIHIESPSSSYRTLEKTNSKNLKITLLDEKLLGKISLCPFILAKQDIRNYYNSDWNQEYKGYKFQILKGSILAIGSQQSFSVDKEIEGLSDLPSIFTIYKKETTELIPIEIEINSDKIKIGMNITDYEKYSPTKFGTEDSINIVNSFLIFPALIYIFERIKENLEDYEEYRWFKAIERIFHKYSLKLDSDLISSKSSLELAQKLMSFPVSKALISLENLGEREE